jgi:hypothetical protein
MVGALFLRVADRRLSAYAIGGLTIQAGVDFLPTAADGINIDAS